MKYKKRNRFAAAAVAAALCLSAVGCKSGTGSQTNTAAEEAAAAAIQPGESAAPKEPEGQVASADETISQEQVVTDDMIPIYGSELRNGSYPIEVDSSSSMFRITACKLTVADGSMEAVMTMSGTGYEKLYLGTGTEAVRAAEADYIPAAIEENGACTFRIPVEALDFGIDCSAFSKNKQKWYDRVLVFRSDSLPADAYAEAKFITAEHLALEDGIYTAEVLLEGGSGRAAVESPARLQVKDGAVSATIVWGSANYDYMIVNDVKYEWDKEAEHSTFEIPISGFDWRMPVIADTIAMSVPHEIAYTLIFDSASLKRVE